jgi:hypothetical protein
VQVLHSRRRVGMFRHYHDENSSPYFGRLVGFSSLFS